MANLGFVIDVNTVPEPKEFDSLPDADYNFQITDSDTVAEDDGKGYVKLTFTVMDGACQGRTHTERYYLWNVSEQRRAIALESLAALGRAIGVYQIGDTQALHMKPLLARVKSSKPNAEGKTYSNLSKYRPYAGVLGGGAAAPASAPAPTGFQGFPGAQAAPAPAFPPQAAPFQQAPAPAPMAAPGGMPAGFPMPGQSTAQAFPQAVPAAVPAAPGGFPGFPPVR